MTCLQYKHELTKKTYSLSDRLKLFESTVSPTVLYGSETWTLTVEMARLLKTTQRRMLRMILGQGRRRIERTHEAANEDQSPDESDDDAEVVQDHEENALEPWVDWIKRVTHNVEDTLERLKIRTWNEQARKRKWRFAAELQWKRRAKVVAHRIAMEPSTALGCTTIDCATQTGKTEFKVD